MSNITVHKDIYEIVEKGLPFNLTQLLFSLRINPGLHSLLHLLVLRLRVFPVGHFLMVFRFLSRIHLKLVL